MQVDISLHFTTLSFGCSSLLTQKTVFTKEDLSDSPQDCTQSWFVTCLNLSSYMPVSVLSVFILVLCLIKIRCTQMFVSTDLYIFNVNYLFFLHVCLEIIRSITVFLYVVKLVQE